jgi:ABC-type transporter Mla MlaB component
VDAFPSESAVSLAAHCTLRDVAELKAALARLVELPGPVTFDGAAVERVDTAVLQLLTAFVVTRRTAGRSVRWHAPSAALLSSADRLGLGGPLQFDERAG